MNKRPGGIFRGRRMKVEVEKVDYMDKNILKYYPSNQKEKEFRLNLRTHYCFSSAALSREQLINFRNEIDFILNTERKPNYTVENRSDLSISLEVEVDE
jgi:hypothetical protein